THTHCCALRSGHPRVIGSPWPTTATPGDDVILPCHLEPRTDARALTVEWELTDMKMAAYAGRASLLAGDLKHGNLSLRIGNVTHADGGRYKCFVPKLWSHAIVLLQKYTYMNKIKRNESFVQVLVTVVVFPSSDRWTRHMWILPVVVIAVTLLATGLALSLTRKHLQPDVSQR
uniref:Ig-like domain-containing protein n=1 Tax=Scophthalmus maximus TaxID=52904 RepID=A0A8D3DY96_SCOMX